MPPLDGVNWWPALVALAAALVLTPLVRALARRYGAVAHPRGDRWHRKPTALLGGVAIAASVAGVCLLLLPRTPEMLAVLGAAAFLFLIGLADDFLHLNPYQKLIAQVMAASVVAYAGLRLPWTASPALNIGLTLLWLIGITNAVNLLDNMDGLASGVVAIASVFLGAVFLDNGQTNEARVMTVFAAALVGFLVYNSNPASIFMGDCGSMFIGFFLAAIALLHGSAGRSRSLLPVLAVPVLVLAIPIFDTVLVTVLRKLAGRPASQGGRDHTSHRLVALGLSERRAVWLLYALAALAGLLGFAVRRLQLDVSLALIAVFSLALTFLGIYLARVKVYDQNEIDAAQAKPLVAFLVDLSYKRRIFEVLLDVALIILAYYLAQTLVVGSLWANGTWAQFVQLIPILVFVKLGAFLAVGVYRGLWRYARIEDLIVYAKGVALGSAGGVVAVVFLFRFQNFSRAMFVLDGLLLMAFVTGSRLSFRLLRKGLPASAPTGRRVLIYGADERGELLLRELRENTSIPYRPVGFADDDPSKTGKFIHGLPVLGDNGELAALCAKFDIAEVLLSSSMPEKRVQEIRAQCVMANIVLKRARLQIEPLVGDDENEVETVAPSMAASAPLPAAAPVAAPPPAPAPRPWWRRWFRRALMLLAVVATLAFIHPELLQWVAHGLMVNDAPVATEVVVIMGTCGGSGAIPLDDAAQLYRNGLVQRVVLIEERTSRLARLGIVPPLDSVVRRELVTREVANEAISTLVVTAPGGQGPARSLQQWLLQNPDTHVTILCDRLSSRRTARAFRHVLAPEQSERIHWRTVPDRRFDETNWWRRRQGVVAVFGEYIALGFVLLRSEEEAPPLWDPDQYEENLRNQLAR